MNVDWLSKAMDCIVLRCGRVGFQFLTKGLLLNYKMSTFSSVQAVN